MGQLLKLLLGALVEDKSLKEIFGKIFRAEIKKFGRQFNPANVLKNNVLGFDVKKIKPDILFKKLKRLTPKELNKFFDSVRKQNKNNKNQVDMFVNLSGQITLSSSFLQYGIFLIEEDNIDKGKLTLAMGGKEYDFGIVNTRLWLTMVEASGKNGSGAGSVLWDTIWYNKRRASLNTGGVAGSIEKLIKRRRITFLSTARNQIRLNKFAKQNPGKRLRIARKASRAKLQRRAK